jgi:hypothetical protein
MRRIRLVAMGVFVSAVVLMLCAGGAGAISNGQLKAKALSLSDFPTGWSAHTSSRGGGSTWGGCVTRAKKLSPRGDTKANVAFADHGTPTLVTETLAAGPDIKSAYEEINRIFSACKHLSITSRGLTIHGTVGAMSFPKVGTSSNAYRMTFTAEGVTVGADIVVFEVPQGIFGFMGYESLGRPDPTTVVDYVTEAVNKVEGKPTLTPTTSRT